MENLFKKHPISRYSSPIIAGNKTFNIMRTVIWRSKSCTLSTAKLRLSKCFISYIYRERSYWGRKIIISSISVVPSCQRTHCRWEETRGTVSTTFDQEERNHFHSVTNLQVWQCFDVDKSKRELRTAIVKKSDSFHIFPWNNAMRFLLAPNNWHSIRPGCLYWVGGIIAQRSSHFKGHSSF